MDSSKPIIRQVNFLSFVPQLILMGLMIFIYYKIQIVDPISSGLLTYLAVSFIVRHLIPRHQRKGIKLYREGLYEKAILEFQKSYDFFKKFQWLDRYRFIFLFSSSRISYLEMAIINMAVCHGKLGNEVKAKELYEKTLEEFPDSEIAKASLNIMEQGGLV